MFLTGCADSAGSHKLISGPESVERVAAYTDLIVSLQPAADVKLTPSDSDSDSDRMRHLIEENIKTHEPNRFASINAPAPAGKTLQATVELKRYDEGNAFARFMLIGLGQIHIDADVILSDFVSKDKLAQYEVTKTFAWGGIYGGATGIKDVEAGFCQAVSDSILGKD